MPPGVTHCDSELTKKWIGRVCDRNDEIASSRAPLTRGRKRQTVIDYHYNTRLWLWDIAGFRSVPLPPDWDQSPPI